MPALRNLSYGLARTRVFLGCGFVIFFHSFAGAQQVFQQGMEFLEPSRYASIPLAAPPVSGPVPAEVDLSSDVPSPGHQGAQASCVGWATAYALKSFQERRDKRWPLNDRRHLFSPAFIYNQINRSGSCSAGTYITDALNLLAEKGSASLADFPYNDSNCLSRPNSFVNQSASFFRIASWSRVNVQSTPDVKAHVAAGMPVVVGLMVYENFQRHVGSNIYSTAEGNPIGGHAMLVIGYDDTRSAFRLINSWGQGWGDDGYVWIDYSIFQLITREGYAAQDIVTPPPVDEQDSNSREDRLRIVAGRLHLTHGSDGRTIFDESVRFDLSDGSARYEHEENGREMMLELETNGSNVSVSGQYTGTSNVAYFINGEVPVRDGTVSGTVRVPRGSSNRPHLLKLELTE